MPDYDCVGCGTFVAQVSDAKIKKGTGFICEKCQNIFTGLKAAKRFKDLGQEKQNANPFGDIFKDMFDRK